jgi:ammonia channel protein AmtB
MNAADTAWIIVATALVLFMTLPGLALFYGGLVRARNVLSVFMQCFGIACLMSVLWLAFGYSIAFGTGTTGYWGGLGHMFLSGVDASTVRDGTTLPEVLFFAFQMTFAIITPALIVGAYVERIGFGFVMTFSGLWMLLCYAPVVHWVWGGGFLADGGLFGATGLKDFAGGVVVHETAWAGGIGHCSDAWRKTQYHHPAAQSGLCDARSCDALGWMVRFQRRITTGSRWRRCDGIDGDAYLCGSSLAHMGAMGAD